MTEEASKPAEPEVIVDPVVPPVKDEVVSRESYLNVSKDMHKYKEKMQAQQQEIEGYQKQLQENETKKLESKEEYKTLWEGAVQRAEKAEKTAKDLHEGMADEKKFSAILVEAKKKGIRDEAMDDLYALDRNGVVVDRGENGRTVIEGAGQYVEELFESRRFWFKDGKTLNIDTAVSNGGLPAGDKVLSPAALLKLERENKVAYLAYTKKHHGMA